MSQCARCGLPVFSSGMGSEMLPTCRDNLQGKLECRDRQIAAQAALLRSVTGKLEEARLRCEELDWNDMSVSQVAALIDEVLEKLS